MKNRMIGLSLLLAMIGLSGCVSDAPVASTATNATASAGTSGASTTTGTGGTGGNIVKSEPPLETPQAQLDAALRCTPFTHPDKPAVLLVHGTFTAGHEQYLWNYVPLLDARGHDVCTVTYPNRGLGDAQISAEYIVNALRFMHKTTGKKVAMIGHSQGVMVPRWALKWWPSAREAVDDYILQAGPNHGLYIADPTLFISSLGLGLPLPNGTVSPVPLPAVFHQFPPYSNFIQATNLGDETPGDIDYTSVYTVTDELIQPVVPVPTAALEYGVPSPKVTNLLLQDLCPLHVVDHITIGTTDPIAFALTMDAISHPGPANIERAGGAALCLNPVPIILDPALVPTAVQNLLELLQTDAANGLPDPNLMTDEPPLKPYAQN